jgi:hypothetical protein
VAVVLPGTASSGRFVTAAFGPALVAAGYALVTGDPPAGPAPLECWRAELAAGIERFRPALLGGVSLGAHLATEWLIRDGRDRPGVEGLLVALPGWLGVPGADTPAVAAALASAALVERDGLTAALRAGRDGVPGWLAEELDRSWSRYRPDELCVTLRATASTAAPTAAALAALRDVPVGVAAFTDDPVHPAAVARRWAALPRRAGYVEQPMAAMATDPAALGAATLAAWRAARRRPARAGRPRDTG